MKKRMWVGGLLVSLWASDLYAQGGPGPAPPPPAPVSLARPEQGSGPAVTLLKPVALKPGDLRPVPLPGGVVPVVYQVPADGARRPMPPGEPAPGGRLPGWPEDDDADQQPSDFAADRKAPAAVVQRVGQSVGPLGLPTGPSALPGVSPGAPAGQRVVQAPPKAELLPPGPLPWAPAPPPAPSPWAPAPPADVHPVDYHDVWVPEIGDPLRKHFYVSAEYLFWWTKPELVPALVTTSDPNNVNQNGRFGFLGQAGTTTLFGGGDFGGAGTSGVRVTAGCWLDMFKEEGLEVSGFVLGRQSTNFSASSANFPVLARPFFNLNANTEFSELVAFPGIATGSVSVNSHSQLWGIEANLRCNVFCCCDQRLDLFGGFRYLNLQESITIVEDIQGLASAPPPFTNQHAQVFDRFATNNSFYGGQIGADYEYRMGRWFLDLKGKLAIGGTATKVSINGGQTFFNPDGSVRATQQGGLLALNSNIGTFHKGQFSFVPEVGLNVGYQVTDSLRVFAGYNFLYWTGVMRPGDQIDRNLDVTRIPNFPVAATPLSQPHPAVPFHTTDFWAQGINVGIEFRY